MADAQWGGTVATIKRKLTNAVRNGLHAGLPKGRYQIDTAETYKQKGAVYQRILNKCRRNATCNADVFRDTQARFGVVLDLTVETAAATTGAPRKVMIELRLSDISNDQHGVAASQCEGRTLAEAMAHCKEVARSPLVQHITGSRRSHGAHVKVAFVSSPPGAQILLEGAGRQEMLPCTTKRLSNYSCSTALPEFGTVTVTYIKPATSSRKSRVKP